METAVGDVIALPRPTRTPADTEIDLPPCGNTWGHDCAHHGPHTCWTWSGWPHTCSCWRCSPRWRP
jgi:hypothetical protein